MAKVEFYYRWSDLYKIHEFAVVDAGCGHHYHLWVFFYLGVYFGCKRKDIFLLPYRPYHFNEPVKTYNINGADKVAKLIYKRIKKILKT